MIRRRLDLAVSPWDGVSSATGRASTTTGARWSTPSSGRRSSRARAGGLLLVLPVASGCSSRRCCRMRVRGRTVVPHRPLPTAGDRHGRVGVIWRWMYTVGADQHAARPVGLGGLEHLARRLHVGAPPSAWSAPGSRSGCWFFRRRRPEDPDEPLRRGPGRRRGAGARVLRRDAARPAQRARRRLSLTVAALRSFDLIYVTTRAAPATRPTVPALDDLPARVRDRPGRVGRGDRGHPARDHHRPRFVITRVGGGARVNTGRSSAR